MSERNIDIFAERLVRLVRDRTIRSCSQDLGPGPLSPVGKHWRAVLGSVDIDALRNVLIPDCVDEAVFYLLNAIDNEEIRLLFAAPDGQIVDLSESGELGGCYMGGESWRERFSNEKFVDYIKQYDDRIAAQRDDDS